MLFLGLTLGLVLGSLALCLADRSLNGHSFSGRSYCESCKHTLAWYDLIPLISYLSLKGRCRYCQAPIKLEYLLVEVGSALVFGLFFWTSYIYPLSPYLIYWGQILFSLFIITVLIIIFLTDIKAGLIPDRITYPAIVAAFFYQIIVGLVFITTLPPGINYLGVTYHLLNPLLAGLLIGFFFGFLILITKGKGMGGGDLKLGIFMGLCLGLPLSIVALMVAFLLGSIVGLALILVQRKKLGQTIPFGPFLAVGTFVSLLWGNQILVWYLSQTL